MRKSQSDELRENLRCFKTIIGLHSLHRFIQRQILVNIERLNVRCLLFPIQRARATSMVSRKLRTIRSGYGRRKDSCGIKIHWLILRGHTRGLRKGDGRGRWVASSRTARGGLPHDGCSSTESVLKRMVLGLSIIGRICVPVRRHGWHGWHRWWERIRGPCARAGATRPDGILLPRHDANATFDTVKLR